MPLYMDVRKNVKAGEDVVAQAHLADLAMQAQYGVNYLRYWYNENAGNSYCLVEAPTPEAAIAVHKEAHGHLADDIIEVDQSMVDAFLGLPQPTASGTPRGDGGLRAIMFTDLEASTALTQKLGDEPFFRILQMHNAIIREALNRHSGNEVKHTGDGILASFVSVAHAVECAVEIQGAFAARNLQSGDEGLHVRVGLSAGEPVEDHGDLFGASVQLAARTCAQALPGQILTSNAVRELCLGKLFEFTDLGDAPLKGFPRPVRLHAVKWQ